MAKKNKNVGGFFGSSFVLIYIFSGIASFVLTYLFVWFMGAVNADFQELGLYLTLTIVVGYSLVVGTVIAFLVTWLMTRDVRVIQIALRRVASGDFNFNIGKPKNKLYLPIFEHINNMIEELKSIQMLKNDFVSNFSHQIKTPLSAVKGYAELLAKSGSLNEQQKQYAQIILGECDRLIDTTTNMSLLGKIENQKLDPNAKVFALDKLIREIIVALQVLLRSKNVQVDVDLPALKFRGNESFLRHVFLNIISNSIKYCSHNPKIKIFAKLENGKQKIFVQDNGIGMDENTKAHIFDKFFQNNPLKVDGGIGLGMTICKKIVDLYDGKILVESQLGKGTTVCVELDQISSL